jgi:DNA-binding MarR family transcriptional regulator
MEKAGLVERRTSRVDGRGVDAFLTDKGMDLLRAAAPLHVTGVRENLVDLCDPADFAALGRVMNTVADRLVVDSPECDIR